MKLLENILSIRFILFIAVIQRVALGLLENILRWWGYLDQESFDFFPVSKKWTNKTAVSFCKTYEQTLKSVNNIN